MPERKYILFLTSPQPVYPVSDTIFTQNCYRVRMNRKKKKEARHKLIYLKLAPQTILLAKSYLFNICLVALITITMK